MGKKKKPAPPDYTGAAQTQGEQARLLAEQNTLADRPNQITPFGTSEWVKDPTGQWTQTVTLTPNEQQALESQQEIQQGRSELAQGLIGRTGEELSQPFGWEDLPPTGDVPTVPTYGENLPPFGDIPGEKPQPNEQQLLQMQQQTGFVGPIQTEGLVRRRPDDQVQREFQGPLQRQMGGGGLSPWGEGPDPSQYTPTDIQESLDFSGLDPIQAGGQYQDRFAQANFDRNMSLMRPEMDRSLAAQETQLRNQGLRPGTEAYDQALLQLRNQQGEAVNRLSQDSILRGTAEQQNQFARELAARQQGVYETGTQGQFANQAANQQMTQNFGIGDRTFGQGLASAQQANALRGQQFGEQAAVTDVRDRQRAQTTGEQLAFGGQQFGQEMQASGYENAIRQQAISEEAQRRGISINEMNALLSGQQVSLPSMPGFMGSTPGQADQLLAAAQMQGQFDASNYATRLGGSGFINALTQGVVGGLP